LTFIFGDARMPASIPRLLKSIRGRPHEHQRSVPM
jgi:hypothetical protein